MTPADHEHADLDRRLNEWLRSERGIEAPRRVARAGSLEILVSKFEPGFSARLHELLDRMPELFDEPSVVAGYHAVAERSPPGTPRGEIWWTAMHEMLRAAGQRHAIPDDRQAEVRTGIDSVHAVLQSVLWSNPVLGDDYTPQPGEIAAYAEALAGLQPDRDVFTRHYGAFEGRSVVNHCPGAAHARVMLAHAWRACTGRPPPG